MDEKLKKALTDWIHKQVKRFYDLNTKYECSDSFTEQAQTLLEIKECMKQVAESYARLEDL